MTILVQKQKIAQKLPNFRIQTSFDLENVIPAFFSLICASFSRKNVQKSAVGVLCFLFCKTLIKENDYVLCFTDFVKLLS